MLFRKKRKLQSEVSRRGTWRVLMCFSDDSFDYFLMADGMKICCELCSLNAMEHGDSLGWSFLSVLLLSSRVKQ
eukprot:scaffold23730_cov127-Cylindrotheca_fusiformis.AAC.2